MGLPRGRFRLAERARTRGGAKTISPPSVALRTRAVHPDSRLHEGMTMVSANRWAMQPVPEPVELSPQELEQLELLLTGRASDAAGGRLALMEKLSSCTLTELIALAVRYRYARSRANPCT